MPVTSPITLTVAGMPNQAQSAKGFSCQPSPGNSELKRATTIQPPSLSPQVGSPLVLYPPCSFVLCWLSLFASVFSVSE